MGNALTNTIERDKPHNPDALTSEYNTVAKANNLEGRESKNYQ